MLSVIAWCLMTVITRYHFCLFSALQNVPFIALKRSDKVEDLCWDLNWPYAMSLCHLSPSALIDMFSEIKDNLHRLIEGLHQGVRLMRVRALQNTVALNALSNRIGK
jgi:polysaccharide pyruvyl transferase WcaK-like protein